MGVFKDVLYYRIPNFLSLHAQKQIVHLLCGVKMCNTAGKIFHKGDHRTKIIIKLLHILVFLHWYSFWYELIPDAFPSFHLKLNEKSHILLYIAYVIISLLIVLLHFLVSQNYGN